MQLIAGKRLHIFDLGGVLVEVDARRTLDAFRALGISVDPAAMSNSHASDPLAADYCDGRVGTAHFLAQLQRAAAPGTTRAQIVRAWNAMIGDPLPEGLAALLQAQRQGLQTALLSNCNSLHTDRCADLLDTYCRRTPLFLSQLTHISKPDPKAWLHLLAQLHCPPEDAAFYDDSQRNCDAARSLGIDARRIQTTPAS